MEKSRWNFYPLEIWESGVFFFLGCRLIKSFPLFVPLTLSALSITLVQAAPYLPKQDSDILEKLPKSAIPVAPELRQLRSQLTQQPDNLQLATDLARRYIKLGRSEADPRYFSYAQAALATWWDQPKPPVDVLVLRATLRQNRHNFGLALNDLAKALAKEPWNAQAWLTRATILQVQGRYQEALSSCVPLMKFSDPLVAAACISKCTSLTGRAQSSYELLRQTLQSSNGASLEEQRWARTLLAKIATRLGQIKVAEHHFKEAMALGNPNADLLAAYADFLLDQERFEEVIKLLRDKTRIDGLLLRLALAEQESGSPEFALHRESLSARFAAGRKRGDFVHQRDEARFTLHLLQQPEKALRLAQTNWTMQREPLDARILLEAALAAHDPKAAEPVLEMLNKTGMEDVRLRLLVAQFKEQQ